MVGYLSLDEVKKMSYLDSLRARYLFLSFLDDEELRNFLTVVRSVARGTRQTENEILSVLQNQGVWKYGNC